MGSGVVRIGMALLLSVASCAVLAQDVASPSPPAQRVVGECITGSLLRHAQFPSRHVAARNVDVWLPLGYDEA